MRPIHILRSQLAADGLSQVKTVNVFNASDVSADGIEGNRMYKRDGTYYILDDHPGDTTYIWKGTSLEPAWEWNHNPDTTRYTVNNGLTLSTATVTSDLYAARNTLTHRIHGEFPVGTVAIDFTKMADGDFFGLAAFRDRSASIGVFRNGSSYSLQVVHNMTQDESTWATTSNGTVVATANISGKKVWLRVSLDARASGTKAADFCYSTNGKTFMKLGPSYTMWTNWAYFMGYRFGIFNYATKALGGSIFISSFTSS
ncbi:putative glycosyl hydrolase family 43 protein [Phaeoacremonium minimum UCRPA7]|uniref:Putative glycosyl hydrolase family 43 protein n=1 Tax=Phaeoacremonium minimum (strain UCR-PA7) TaxID=1286976 RepID=R8BGA9_PHAM7|nr:putative glycosyl hydrolase family 43 protein [Phaeoacremonium minimum UCRPA7]EON98345.1 putative glycosyl hydrolase family 43 protein [Phaeoacremonium minimum UCRPA7]